MTRIIVIAWIENDGFEPTGRMIRFDGVNYKPEFASVPRAHAVVWLNHGTADDEASARAHAARQDHSVVAVYTYSTCERDPLGKARARIMSEAR